MRVMRAQRVAFNPVKHGQAEVPVQGYSGSAATCIPFEYYLQAMTPCYQGLSSGEQKDMSLA